MTDSKIIASAYQDPLFDQLRQEVQGCDDNYPVIMLPVRIETRFKKETRYITVINPNEVKITGLIEKLRKLIYDARLANRSKLAPGQDAVTKILEGIKKTIFNEIPTVLITVKEFRDVDKQIIRETLADLKEELDSPVFRVEEANKKMTEELLKQINKMLKSLNKLPGPVDSPFKPGWDALNELQKLEVEISRIYGNNPLPASQLDDTLRNTETCMKRFTEIMEDPGFLASDQAVMGIESKISFIKRIQKNSPVNLKDFRKAYAGTYDLVNREYQLRNEINDLKTRIDQDYVPYMNLLGKLQQYPVKLLGCKVDKAATLLRASNDAGYASAGILLKERDDIYDLLRNIREYAHRPLRGSINDIRLLKNGYDNLEKEILRYMDWSHKVKPLTRAHRIGLSRLRTHLSGEYLEDLKQLRSTEKTIESQVFSNEKVRATANAFRNTLSSLKEAKDYLRRIKQPGDKAAILADARLEELDQKVQNTASNTILLPREIFNETRSAFQSLKSQVENFYNSNNISENHYLKNSISARLKSIENSITDQLTDVFNEKDRFYDEFRKRITFLVKTETVNELCVRIYPDDIALDNHDERLTENELKVGKDYYNEIYSRPASERQDTMLAAWRAAATALGARRAAYVVKSLRPDEVKNNRVPNPANRLKKILVLLARAFSVKRILWTEKHGIHFSQIILSLPENLRTILKPAHFNPCTRTRPDLDRLAKILDDSFYRYQKELINSDDGRLMEYRQEFEALRSAREIIQQYLRDNLIALNTSFDPGLTFPSVTMRSKDWDRAGLTSVMPDRFIVVTKRDGKVRQIKVGKAIPPSLQVGFDPDTNDQDEFHHLENGELYVPEKLRWMFEFDAAVDAGMAVRVPLTQEDFEKGFDFVMAYGIRTHKDLASDKRAAKGQELLNDLMENHLCSDGGLEFLPVGTATNNTDYIKSPFKTLDDDYDGLFNLFINPSVEYINRPYDELNELEITDGQYFSDALGLPLDIAAYIRNHNKLDIAQSRAMSRLLYGATFGYYMRFMMRNLFNDNDIFQTLIFLMRHVSAVGNLPSFRINKQPYGVIPITLYNKLWVDEPTTKGTFGSYLHKLSMFLSATRKVFDTDMLQKVNTINSENYDNDPQKVFLEILGHEPYSKEFIFREGANVGGRWGNIEDNDDLNVINWSEDAAVNPSILSDHYKYLLTRLGHSGDETRKKAILKSRAYGARYINTNDILGHLVQNPDFGRGTLEKQFTVAKGAETLNLNYIQYLEYISGNPNALFEIPKNKPVDEKFNTLLFELVRISLMYDNGNHARRAAEKIWDLDVPALERLMAGHLDLCSYRIDAWLSGLADYRLRELRKTKPVGIFIGAYGYVENLRPAPPKSRVQHFPEGLEPDNGAEVSIMTDNQGFIHGPSLNHAVTAAVLRAGYNSQKKNENDTNNIFGINMSSSRIRKALHILEGVAGGQESGALLGYQYERALHERYKDDQGKHLEMDVYIYRLRRKFPTYSDNPASVGTAFEQQENLKALNVVDGIAFMDYMEEFILKSSDPALQWNDDKTFVEMMIQQSGNNFTFPGYPYGLENDEFPDINEPGKEALNKQKLRAIIHELDNMADSFDALSDLITAEGVYQLVRGNHTRAGAVLSAMSEGRVPTDPEIIKTMREGNIVSHRVLLTLDPVGVTPSWSAIPSSPRSLAEPALNRWLGEQLGDPGKIDWRVNFKNTITYISLADLNMQPIDLVLLAESGEQGLAELELRTAAAAREKGALASDTIHIDFGSCTADATASLEEYLALIRHLGKIVLKTRTADARDFRIAESDECFGIQAPAIDTVEIYQRLQNTVSSYQYLKDSLDVFIPLPIVPPEILSLAVQKSIELTDWGFNGYYPNIQTETDKNDLVARIISAKEKIIVNLAKANQLLELLTLEPDQLKWLDKISEICDLIFGKGFKMLPKLVMADAANLNARMNEPFAGGILRNLSAEDLESWLADASMVRKNLAPIDTVRMLTDLYSGQKTPFSVVQSPEILKSDGTRDEYWLGAAYPEGWKPEGDKLSLVIFGYKQLTNPVCAVVFDEWTEIIPARIQTTGIALHYNQPDARPPQALLLAVTPDKTGAWSLDDLGLIVEESYNMARIRAVEPDHFDKTMLAQVLPATTLLSGGEEEVVRYMFDIEQSKNGVNLKGVLADLSSINGNIDRVEI